MFPESSKLLKALLLFRGGPGARRRLAGSPRYWSDELRYFLGPRWLELALDRQRWICTRCDFERKVLPSDPGLVMPQPRPSANWCRTHLPQSTLVFIPAMIQIFGPTGANQVKTGNYGFRMCGILGRRLQQAFYLLNRHTRPAKVSVNTVADSAKSLDGLLSCRLQRDRRG
jgi:hypothetical protein